MNGSITIFRPPMPPFFALTVDAHAFMPATVSWASAITATRISVGVMPGSDAGGAVVGGVVGLVVGGIVGGFVGGVVGGLVGGEVGATVGGVVDGGMMITDGGGVVGATVGAVVAGAAVDGGVVAGTVVETAGNVGVVDDAVEILSVPSPLVAMRVMITPTMSAPTTALATITVWRRVNGGSCARRRGPQCGLRTARNGGGCVLEQAGGPAAISAGSRAPLPPEAPWRRRAYAPSTMQPIFQ